MLKRIKETGAQRSNDVLLRNIAYIFMIGFLVYHWFPFPPAFWRFGLVALCVIGLTYHARYKYSTLEKAILVFVTINIVYFFVSFLWQVPESTNFGNVLCSTLPMFLFFVLTARGVITDKSLLIFVIIASVAGVFYFRHAEEMIIMRRITGEEGSVTVNASSIFLVILPLLFFIKNKYVVFAILAEILFFLLLGAKRGNIVACIMPIFLLFRKNIHSRANSVVRNLIIVGFIGLFVYAYNLAINNEYLLGRYDDTLEGDSSGREFIYAAAWNKWLNSDNLFQMVFGHGTDATRHLIGIRAHNDWLEILVDFGLFGAIFYLTFFIALLRTAWKHREDSLIFYVLLSVFCIWFAKSLFSMGFTENLFSYLSMAIGIVLGRVYIKEKSLLRKK